MRALVLLSCLLLTAGVASAQAPWFETGDAGDLPATAQVPAGTGPLPAIHGSLTVQTDDADMFLIHIDDPACFTATTCGGSLMDTALWLFDTNGIGISFNDDDPGGCGLQSTLTGAFVPAPGDYYIAISGWDTDAADGAGLEIWLDTPYGVERAPDGPGAPGPIAMWLYDPFEEGDYIIAMTCASYITIVAVEPTTWGHVKGLYK
jgi:hypothetical protein